MLVEIICGYLNEIGVLELNHINEFLSIFKELNPKNSSKEESINKIKQTLFLYIKKILNEENQINSFCDNIITSFLNARIVNKYKQLNFIVNMIKTKISCYYIYFFMKLINCKNNKKKNKFSCKSLKSSNNRNSAFYNTFRPEMNRNNSLNVLVSNKNINKPKNIFNDYISQRNQKLNNNNDIKSYTYYTPFINVNQKNQDALDDENNYLTNSFYIPNNYYEKNNFVFNDNNNNINNPTNTNNYYTNTNDNIYNALPIKYNSNNNINNHDNFLQNEEKHIQRVRDKIINMKMDNFAKNEQECTFTPKIHIYHPRNDSSSQNSILVYENNMKNRTFNKLKNVPTIEYHIESPNNSHININNDNNNKSPKLYKNYSYSIYDKQRDEILKEQISRFTFAPKITNNDKYKVNTTFEERRMKSIEKKKQQEYELRKILELKNKKNNNKSKNKEIVERLYTNEIKKIKNKTKINAKNQTKPIINWDKRYKESLNKYTDSKNYKKKN